MYPVTWSRIASAMHLITVMLHLFGFLDEHEHGQDFMRYCLIKCHIKSREIDSAYNEQLDGVVKRFKMLQGATTRRRKCFLTSCLRRVYIQ
ncbi:hypothetical protein Plhal304r1_c019g0068011 [Plasmopara halstedii]